MPALVEAGATAVELMVNPTLIAASYSLPGIPEEWRDVPPDGAVLLVELRTDDPSQLDGMEQRALKAVEGHELLETAAFTGVPEEIEVFWLVREGMQGIVGAMRPQGTSLMIEDVCVRPDRIAECARDLQALLGKYEFLTGVAGHASAGNLHFLLTPALGDPADRDRYEGFMAELVDLIVGKYDGSLKAEHGTGRNMAPYVEREWGERATELMWRVKRLADPDGVLNPGAVLSDDPGIHLAGLKSTPRSRTCRTPTRASSAASASRSAQPRPHDHAASAHRAAPGDGPPARGLAGAGGAGARLPVRRARHVCGGRLVQARVPGGDRHGRAGEVAADGLALARRGVARAAGGAAVVRGGARRPGRPAGGRPGRAGRCGEARPALARLDAPRRSRAPSETRREGAAAVYLPACINRMFGVSRAGTERWVVDALVQASARAGKPVWIPPDAAGNVLRHALDARRATRAGRST